MALAAAAWGGATESELKAAGAEAIAGGVRINGWLVQTCKGPILTSASRQEWEEMLETAHLPEMVFGESSLSLQHIQTGVRLHFSALDALKGWKQESLPPVEVPAAAKWKFRSKPSEQVILDYDYTFTTPYCGSDAVVLDEDNTSLNDGCSGLCWEDTDERIDLAALSAKEPILFYDEVILYEDELADNGISLLTVRVLRVDGVLMRLRDTRVYCAFGSSDKAKPVVLRESCWREATFASLSAKGFVSDSAVYGDPNLIAPKLPIVMQKTQKLKMPS